MAVKKINPNDRAAIDNLNSWSLYFRGLESARDIEIPPGVKNWKRLSVAEIDAQVKSGNGFFCGTDGLGANASIKILDEDVRQVLCSPGTLRCGQYLRFESAWWLVASMPGNNGVYEKAVAWYCKNILRFRGSDGQILEYPIVNRNATQYNDGETSKQQLTLGTAKHLIYIPFDSDTIKLDNGARFLLDKNRENPTAFKLTQVDSTSYAFGEIGLLQWTVVEDLFVPERDNKQLMIAHDVKISGSADTQGGDFWG